MTDMYATFSQCENLTDLNIIIPESVTNLQYTFGNCLKLSGVIEVNANVTGQLINDKLDYNFSYHFEQIKNDIFAWQSDMSFFYLV